MIDVPGDRNLKMELHQIIILGLDQLGQPIKVFNKFISLWCSLVQFSKLRSGETPNANQIQAVGLYMLECFWPGRDIDTTMRFVFGHRIFNIEHTMKKDRDEREVVMNKVMEDANPKPFISHGFGWIAHYYTEPLVFV
jgi:hypothetical protein